MLDNIVKRFNKWALVIVIGVILATFLSSIVYVVDSPSLSKHLKESGRLLAKEELYYHVSDENTAILDNYTDSLMLLIASYRGHEGLLDKGMNNYREYVEGTSPYEQIIIEDENVPTRVIAYYRYWHGYTLFLRPLLVFFNYEQIRIINTIVQVLLLILIAVLMAKNKVGLFFIPLLSAYWLINPIAIFYSLQYSTIWYIICFSIIAYLLLSEKIIRHHYHYLFFTIIGMITSYMDFLTYPIATLGIILLLVLIKEKLPFQEAIKRILVCGICWVFGYGIMWASKWMLAAVITGKDVIKNALDQAVYRTSDYTWDPNKKITRISAIREALGAYETGSVIKIIAFNFVIAISIFIYNCLGTKKDSFNALLKRSLNYLPILGLSFIPFVWYLVLANHSLIHTFFSFRTALVLWFAINAYIFAVFVKREDK